MWEKKHEGRDIEGIFFTAGIQPASNESSFKVAPVKHGGGKSGGLMWAQCVL